MAEWKALFKDLELQEEIKEDDLEIFNKLSSSWTSSKQQKMFLSHLESKKITTWEEFAKYLSKNPPESFFPYVIGDNVDLKALSLCFPDVTVEQLEDLFKVKPSNPLTLKSFKKTMTKLLKSYVKDITND